MLKRVLYGSGAMGVLTAGYLLGSVSLSGAFAQTAPAAAGDYVCFRHARSTRGADDERPHRDREPW